MMKKWVIVRRTSQFISLFLFIYILWSTTYPLSGAIPAKTFFLLDPLIMFTTSLSERVMLGGIIFAFLMILLTFILGRFFCGWFCPLGTMIDVIGALRKKHLSINDSVNKKIRLPKFFILTFIVILSVFGIQAAWILDPIVIMARFVSLNFIPIITLMIDKTFIFIIQKFGLYGFMYDFYRDLKASFLGIHTYYFSHSLIVFVFFLFIAVSALFLRRGWCRVICPLGALYGLFARYSLLERVVKKCIDCKHCKSTCRTGAITDDASYVKNECILCMDCLYDCSQHSTRFAWRLSADKKDIASGDMNNQSGISRRSFFIVAATSLLSFAGSRNRTNNLNVTTSDIIRPPAALREEKFLDRCIRCGNCMKVCITNGLQPVLFEGGFSGIWTPRLVPQIGYCEYNCRLCGQVCPTGAIPSLTIQEKKMTKLGIASVDVALCLPWSKKQECIVCEEHCPIPEKAIKLIKVQIDGKVLLKPYVDRDLCVGCGICENKCPVRPRPAIRVAPKYATRT